jgi:hypothetical protein
MCRLSDTIIARNGNFSANPETCFDNRARRTDGNLVIAAQNSCRCMDTAQETARSQVSTLFSQVGTYHPLRILFRPTSPQSFLVTAKTFKSKIQIVMHANKGNPAMPFFNEMKHEAFRSSVLFTLMEGKSRLLSGVPRVTEGM